MPFGQLPPETTRIIGGTPRTPRPSRRGAGFILPFSSILIPLLAQEHRWGATGAGVLVGVQAAGTVVTTLIVSKRGVGTRAGLIAVGGLATVGLGQLVVGVTGTLPGAVVGVLLMGLAGGAFVTHLNPVLIKAAPPEYLARVQALQALRALAQSVTLLVTNNAIGPSPTRSAPRPLFAAARPSCWRAREPD